jgi:hypothetical protein
MTIYLYVKTHRVTGLKYLGKTKQNPYKYKGSGKYWKDHLRKHGNLIDTEILGTYQKSEELKTWGLYYSNLWNIVEDSTWANLKPEDGDGGTGCPGYKHTEEFKKRLSLMKTGKTLSENHKKAMSLSRLGYKWGQHTEESKQRIRNQRHTEEFKSKLSESRKGANNPMYGKGYIQTGENNPCYNYTIYNFIHISGIVENCTLYQLRTKYGLNPGNLGSLVAGRAKSIKGWRMNSQ